MIRFWLVLLLSLALWPHAAAASTGAPEHQRSGISASHAELAHEVARASGGLELLTRLEIPQNTRGSSRSATDQHDVLSGYESLAVRVRLLVGDTPVQVEEAAAPLCETFPYYATAPPSLR